MSMTSKVGYDFYFYDQSESSRLVLFPITPSKLDITVGSRNETIELINEGQINLPKGPALIDIEFEATFPRRQYPFSREPEEYETYFAIFNSLKANKIPFRFIMIRGQLAEVKTEEQVFDGLYWDYEPPSAFGESNYNILCVIEEMKITEDANNGFDIVVDFKLRQYKPYGPKSFRVKGENTSTSTATQSRTVLTPVTAQMYTVKSTDTLSIISKKFYDDATLWQRIYDANKDVIERAARNNGKVCSQNGAYIFEGTVLTIPIKG